MILAPVSYRVTLSKFTASPTVLLVSIFTLIVKELPPPVAALVDKVADVKSADNLAPTWTSGFASIW